MSIRVVTWNMQGGGPGASKWLSDVSRFFLQQEVQMACLQECGTVPSTSIPGAAPLDPDYPSASFTWNPCSSKSLGIFWLKAMAGNLAIVAPIQFLSKGYIIKSGDVGPLALGTVFNTSQNVTLGIYTSNTFLAAGPRDPVLLRQIASSSNQQAWFAVGDFNQIPMDWIWDPNRMPPKALYCGHVPGTTPLGSVTSFDYGIIYAGATQLTSLPAGRVDLSCTSSEHMPVFYELPFDLA